MVEIPAILRLMREYIALEEHLREVEDTDQLDLPTCGITLLAEISFMFYFVMLRLASFTNKPYEKEFFDEDLEFKRTHGDLGTDLYEVYKYMGKNTCAVEVLWKGSVQQLYFRKKTSWLVEHIDREEVRCAFFDSISHSRMPLVLAPASLKRAYV
jgi:hypothetical protein